MNYFQADQLSKSFADKRLFENISFGIEKGQKTGLIARNGAGKTTLINIMMQRDIADSGTCNFRNDIRVAFLEQNPEFDPQPTVLDTILSESSPATRILKEYQALINIPERENSPDNQKKLQVLIQKIDELDAWNLEARIKQVLSQLKIDNTHQRMGELSGGQIKRVALARILIEQADFIILDEPTNHLDIEMIEWLEDYLDKSNLTLLLVTHDRYFLDRVCNEILEIDNGEIYRYRGNYAYFLSKKQEREDAQLAQTEKARNLLRKETEWMRRQPKARTTKSKARIDAYQNLKKTSAMTTQPGQTEILMQTTRMGRKILELEEVSKKFDEKVVIEDFSYIFKKKEKAAIVGMNGTGKTTLLNIITGRLQPDRGKVTTGETIQFGYFTQEGLQADPSKRVIDVVKDIAESIQVGKGVSLSAAQFLHFFNFPYQAQNDFVYKLSGGEKRRLHLLTVLMKNPNFLILDEPTNDLDIATLNVLENFLEEFQGCLIVVSHDRYFLDKIADHTFVFEGNGKIRDFPGNYTDYLQKKSEEKQQEKATTRQEKTPEKAADNKEKQKLTYKEQKEFELLEKEIENLESEKAILLEKMNSGELNSEELREVGNKYSEIEQELDKKEIRWLELSQWT